MYFRLQRWTTHTDAWTRVGHSIFTGLQLFRSMIGCALGKSSWISDSYQLRPWSQKEAMRIHFEEEIHLVFFKFYFFRGSITIFSQVFEFLLNFLEYSLESPRVVALIHHFCASISNSSRIFTASLEIPKISHALFYSLECGLAYFEFSSFAIEDALPSYKHRFTLYKQKKSIWSPNRQRRNRSTLVMDRKSGYTHHLCTCTAEFESTRDRT